MKSGYKRSGKDKERKERDGHRERERERERSSRANGVDEQGISSLAAGTPSPLPSPSPSSSAPSSPFPLVIGWLGSCDMGPAFKLRINTGGASSASNAQLLRLLKQQHIFVNGQHHTNSFKAAVAGDKFDPFEYFLSRPYQDVDQEQENSEEEADDESESEEDEYEYEDQQGNEADSDDADVNEPGKLRIHLAPRSRQIHLQFLSPPMHYSSAVSSASYSSAADPSLSSAPPSSISSECRGWLHELSLHPLEFWQHMTPTQFVVWLESRCAPNLINMLFIFSVCHYIIITQTSHQMQLSWFRLLRVLQIMKSLLLSAPPLAPPATGNFSPSILPPNPLYQHLLHGLNVSQSTLKQLQSFSNYFPLCFVPCVSFWIHSSNLNLSAEQRVAMQLRVTRLCNRLKLTSAANTPHSPSPASAMMVRQKMGDALLPPMPVKGKKGYDSLYEPGVIGEKGSTKEEGGNRDGRESKYTIHLIEPPKPPPAPLFYLSSSSSSVVLTDFVSLLSSRPDLATTQEAELQSRYSTLLRQSLREGVKVAKKHLDTVVALTGLMGADRQQVYRVKTIIMVVKNLHHNLFLGGLSTTGNAQNNTSWLTKLHSVPPTNQQDEQNYMHAMKEVLDQHYALFQPKHTQTATAAAVTAPPPTTSPPATTVPTDASAEVGSEDAGGEIKADLEFAEAADQLPTTNSPSAHISAATPPSPPVVYSRIVYLNRVAASVKAFHRLLCGLEIENATVSSSSSSSSALAISQPDPDLPLSLLSQFHELSVWEHRLRSALHTHWTAHRGCDSLSLLSHPCIYSFKHELQNQKDGLLQQYYNHRHHHHSLSALIPLYHSTSIRNIKVTCSCGFSLRKLATDPFSVARLRSELTNECCSKVDCLSDTLFSTGNPCAGVNGGWNVYRIGEAVAYRPERGLAALAGFNGELLPRSNLLHITRFTAQSTSHQFSSMAGVEYECSMGHRFIAPEDPIDLDAGQSSSSSKHSRGVPKSITPLFIACLVCKHIRVNGAQAQLQGASGSQSSSASGKSFKDGKKTAIPIIMKKPQPTPSSHPSLPPLRAHDRYAQLRRLYIVTPPESEGIFWLDPQVRSVKQTSHTQHAAGSHSSTSVAELDQLLWSNHESAAAAFANIDVNDASINNATPEELAASPESYSSSSSTSPAYAPLDVFTPSLLNPPQRYALPSSSFFCIALPWIYLRPDKKGEPEAVPIPEARRAVLVHRVCCCNCLCESCFWMLAFSRCCVSVWLCLFPSLRLLPNALAL